MAHPRAAHAPTSAATSAPTSEPLFAPGCEIQCHMRVKGTIAALMPELASGVSTRAVAIPCHPSPSSHEDADGAEDEAEVQWLERFIVRLPAELCEALLARGPLLDPQVSHFFCLYFDNLFFTLSHKPHSIPF